MKLLASTLVVLAATAASAAPADEAPAYAPGEVIVQMKERTSGLRRDAALARARARIAEHVSSPWGEGEGPKGLLRLTTDLPVEEAVAELERDPDVEFAEPNWLCRASAVSNDTYYTGGSLWGAFGNDLPAAVGPTTTTNAFGSQAEKAWGAGQTGSRTIYVGIVDEGVQFAHPDLAANVWTNPFDPANGVDDDRNGYVDDVHGWDFYNRDATVYDGTGDDHGTHVAGTIGAVGGNGAGIAGMNWNVTMIPLKFLGPDTGRISDAVKALDYMVDLKQRHGLNVVAGNHSWSSDGYSQALHDAVIRAAKAGILTVCAAGNSTLNNDTATVYPANFDTTRGTSTASAATYDAVISVAAIDRNGGLATFSDYGASSVDLGAPGVGVASTLPESRYGNYSGTSMAAPHVTGAAALYASARPGATAQEIRQALLGNVIATPSLAGKTVTGGRLNVGDGFLVTRNVAVESLSVPPVVTMGVRTVSAVVANTGGASETFTVSMTDVPPAGGRSGLFSAAQTVTLAPGSTKTVTFSWTTTNATLGSHVVTAAASRLNGEAVVDDNSRSQTVTLTAPPRTPAVYGISPVAVRGGTTQRVTVTGAQFEPGATLSFQGTAGSAPQAGSVIVASTGSSLTATVATVPDAQRLNRYWDVVVTNPSGTSGRRSAAFRVYP